MGLGDQLMATGLARGAAARGKRIAFGDGRKIHWDGYSEPIFRGNPNIAPPGSEHARNIEWVKFYKGHRLYNAASPNRWIWNHSFRATPGEVFLTAGERQFAAQAGRGFVIIEPNVPPSKSVAPNKQWALERYDRVAVALKERGHDVVQMVYGPGYRIPAARQFVTPDFRHALAVLERAALYIGPEGGLHHGAAAVGTSAVVLFGGFIPPSVTGYAAHTNLTGGAEACGSLRPCCHCMQAMAAISVDEVLASAMKYLPQVAA